MRGYRHILALDRILANGRTKGLVGDTEHHDNITVLRLGDELGDDTDVVECALCVGDTHRTVQNIDLTNPSRVVPAILRARKSVQIQVHTKTILASPLNGLQQVPVMPYCKPGVRERLREKSTYFHEVFARKGSPWRVSIAHQPIGIRTKLRPAAAISAKSVRL